MFCRIVLIRDRNVNVSEGFWSNHIRRLTAEQREVIHTHQYPNLSTKYENCSFHFTGMTGLFCYHTVHLIGRFITGNKERHCRVLSFTLHEMPNEWHFCKLISHSWKKILYGNSLSSYRLDVKPSLYISWCRPVIRNDAVSALFMRSFQMVWIHELI